MLILAIIIGIILIIAMTPVGVDASYLENDLKVFAKVGPFRFKVFPTKVEADPGSKKLIAKGKRAEKKAKMQAKTAEKKDVQFTAGQLLELVKLGLHGLRRFRRRVRVRELTLHYVAAGEDPYNTALQFGYLTAAVNALRPLSDRVLKIRNKDIRMDLSFVTDKPVIAARFIAVIPIGDIILIGLNLATEYLKIHRARAKTGKGSTQDEKRKDE